MIYITPDGRIDELNTTEDIIIESEKFYCPNCGNQLDMEMPNWK